MFLFIFMPTFADYERTTIYTCEYYKRNYSDLGTCTECSVKITIYPTKQEISNDYHTSTSKFIALCDQCFSEKFILIRSKVEDLSKKYGLYSKDYRLLSCFRIRGGYSYCLEDIENKVLSKHKVDTIGEVFELIEKRRIAKLTPRQEELDDWFGDSLGKVKTNFPQIKFQIDLFLEKGKGSVRAVFEEWEGLVFLEETTHYRRLINFVSNYCQRIGAKAKNLMDLNYLMEQALDDYVEDQGAHTLINFPPYCRRLYKRRHPQAIFPNNNDGDELIAAVGIG